jgi:hypothetical protein
VRQFLQRAYFVAAQFRRRPNDFERLQAHPFSERLWEKQRQLMIGGSAADRGDWRPVLLVPLSPYELRSRYLFGPKRKDFVGLPQPEAYAFRTGTRPGLALAAVASG